MSSTNSKNVKCSAGLTKEAHRMAVANDLRNYADRDYIATRTLYRNDCKDQFLYVAVFTLEKYMKSALLYHGVSSKGVGHDLEKLQRKCERHIKGFGLSPEVIEFISELNGHDKVRYPDFPFFVKNTYLLALDSAVFEVRFFATSKDKTERLARQTKESIVRTLGQVKGKNVGNIMIGGYLEKVLKNRNGKHAKERANLVWKNFCYGHRRKASISFEAGSWSKNNHMFAGGEDWQLAAYESVENLMQFSKPVRKHFEEMRDKRRESHE